MNGVAATTAATAKSAEAALWLAGLATSNVVPAESIVACQHSAVGITIVLPL